LRYGIVYLHGFASHPASDKAVYFRRHFESKGVPFVAPRLDGGDFRNATVTKMLQVTEKAVAELPSDRALVLMGSSLGGLAAALYAERHQSSARRPHALVLIAPAFEFGSLWRRRLGPEKLSEWKQRGELELAENGQWVYGEAFARVSYELYEDALRYEPMKFTFPTPTLVFHGAKDDQVPLDGSQRFADAPNVQLVVYAQGAHPLMEHIDDMRAHVDAFLTARNLRGDRESKQHA
jgi:uncharacterized protein